MYPPPVMTVLGRRPSQVQEDCRDGLYSWLPYATCSLLVIISFSQRSFPSTLTFFTGAG